MATKSKTIATETVAAEIDKQVRAANRKGAYGDSNLSVIERPKVVILPPEAPVRALGTHGSHVYFLDAHGQVRDISAERLGRLTILHLFGEDTDWIYSLWPKWKKKEDTFVISGWESERAQESLFHACAQRGIWSPKDFVRGRGAWRHSDGRLVIHTGQTLYFSDGEQRRPGILEPYVYPADERIVEPASDSMDTIDGQKAAGELMLLFEKWNWSREEDPRLLLGWVVSAMMAGALKIRPLLWMTGEKGTGKSTLIGEDGVIPEIFGKGIITTANTSAAGLYQKIGYDALPVAVDEIEAKRGSQKTEAVIELARQAFSGGMVLRGGQDHEGKEFRAMCPVLFGSILIPPLLPQDMSRMAILNLQPIEPGTDDLKLDWDRIRSFGPAMLRRVLSEWKRWDEVFNVWREYLLGLGHTGRAADQFGTLLAAADFMLSDGIPTADQMRVIAGSMTPIALMETQADDTNATRCVQYAMSRPSGQHRSGEIMSIGELVAAAVGILTETDMENPPKIMDAVRFLERSGITVAYCERDGSEQSFSTSKVNKIARRKIDDAVECKKGNKGWIVVCFASQGAGILELFRGSDWEGVPGAINPYSQALERVDGAVRLKRSIRIGHQPSKAVAVPLERCVDLVPET